MTRCPRPCSALLLLSLIAPGVRLEAARRVDRHGDPLPEGALARLGTIRQRVAASHLAISADGRTLVTVAAGRAITRWEASSGKMRGYRLLPGKPTREFWLSSHGRLLAVAEDKSLAVFDTETGACKSRLAVSPQGVAFRPDGKALVTVEDYKLPCRIRVWELEANKYHLLAKVPTYVNAFVFRPDGKRLFVAANGSLRCWDMDSGKQGWLNDRLASDYLAVSRDGKTVCSNGYEGLYLWEADTGRLIGGGSEEKMSGFGPLAFAPDGRTMFQRDLKGVLLRDLTTGKIRRRFAGDDSSFVLAPDGKTLISLRGALLRRWDVESGKPLYPDTSEHGHTDAVCGVVFTPDGKGLVTLGADKTIRLWDRSSQQPRTLLTGVRPRYGASIIWSPDSCRTRLFPAQVLAVTADSRRLLSDASDGQLRLTDMRTGKEVRRFDARTPDHMLGVGAVRLSADDRTLWTLTYHCPEPSNTIIFDQKETLISWDLATGRQLASRFVVCGNLEDNIIAPDGRTVALGTGCVRDARSGKERLKQPNPPLNYPFAFSADSRLVAATADREHWNAVAVYEVLTGRPLVQVEAAVSWYSRLAFSPDGRLLIATGRDALHVWEVSTGRRLLHLPAANRFSSSVPGLFANCLAVAPDGRSAATGHDDGTALLWDLAPAWKRLADRPVAPLTPAQLVAYWADLLKNDPRAAYPAMDRMAAAPAMTLSLLRKHLRPVTIDPQWLRRRLADLDSAEFAVREKASRDLEGVVEALKPRLQREMKRTSSLEVRRRLRRVLLEAPRTVTLFPEVVRRLRAVAVLECIATSEARALLRKLAKGAEGDPLTRAAHAALTRMTANHTP